MANLDAMVNTVQQLQQGADARQVLLTQASGGVGAAVGSAFGVPPQVGYAVGSALGSIASSLIPTYESVRASVKGVNFVTMQLKPYFLEVDAITQDELKRLDAHYKYFGVESQKVEPLQISSYMYNKHAYVQGYLTVNTKGGTIPIKRFQQINAIFQKGVHIIED